MPNRSWRHKMFYIFRFLQCDMVLGIINLLSWIFHAISKENNCLISMPFLTTYIDVRTINFFPPAESWLVNLNFRAQAACKARRTRVKNAVRMRVFPASGAYLPLKLYAITKQTRFRPRNSKKQAPHSKDKLRISRTQSLLIALVSLFCTTYFPPFTKGENHVWKSTLAFLSFWNRT